MTCNVELGSQETKLELLTVLKTRLRAYAVSLPGYAIDRSIDNSAHRFDRTGDLPLLFPPYAPFSLARRSIDSFTFVATNIFIVQGLQYSILHFDFPWATNIALWVSWSCSYCTVAYLRVFILHCLSLGSALWCIFYIATT